MDFHSVDAVNNLLSNGILVQTAKGLVCMSLNDALSSDLNLSVEDLQNLATELLLQQDAKKSVEKPLISVQSVQAINSNFVSSDGQGDSDGFTSESSDAILLPSTSSSFNHCPSELETSTLPVSDSDASSIVISSKSIDQTTSDEQTGIITESQDANVIETSKLPAKKRGGWPKGRKRKPELLHLPPKAPSTGYNLYLNEQRLLFKKSSLAFHEITKLIGNKWSSLRLDEKKPYLEKAEEEKRRYREELRVYRQSGAYQLYLANKRRNRSKYNVLSESDMDATDDLDEEDNEELYCRTCDQYFHNLHNKREHLQGRQHMQMLAGAIHSDAFSSSLDDSSLDGLVNTKVEKKPFSDVAECMKQVTSACIRRDAEIKSNQRANKEKSASYAAMFEQMTQLKERDAKLRKDIKLLKDFEKDLERKVMDLWQLPSWLVINDNNQ